MMETSFDPSKPGVADAALQRVQTALQQQQAPKSTNSDFGPKTECFVNLSKDKKWVIHKTVITDIKPVSYYKKVMEGEPYGTK